MSSDTIDRTPALAEPLVGAGKGVWNGVKGGLLFGAGVFAFFAVGLAFAAPLSIALTTAAIVGVAAAAAGVYVGGQAGGVIGLGAGLFNGVKKLVGGQAPEPIAPETIQHIGQLQNELLQCSDRNLQLQSELKSQVQALNETSGKAAETPAEEVGHLEQQVARRATVSAPQQSMGM